MKNILGELPTAPLHGRLKFTVDFVSDVDLAGKTVLDIGCGYGWCEINFLSRKVKKIFATELTPSDLTTISANLTDKRVRLQAADATRLPFKNSSFDTVVSWEVLEHLPKATQQKMFSESFRVLKPGGKLYFSTPYASLTSRVFDPAWWLIEHRHYSKIQLENFARNVGFKIQDMTVRGRLWEVIATLNFYFCKWLLRRKPLFEKKIAHMLDNEYQQEGYYDVFVKLLKPKTKQLHV